MSYNVYMIKHAMAMQDPDMPQPRYHHVIFIETEQDGTGYTHHVTGDITSGMVYASRKDGRPEDSETYIGTEFLGKMKAADYPQELHRVLRGLPPPPKQKHFNIATMKTEQVKSDGTFYAPGETRPPMFKCTEWTVNQAIPALYSAGIVQK